MTIRAWWRAWRELVLAGVPALAVVVGGFWLAAQYIAPAVPRQLVIAASSEGSPYYEAAMRYRAVLAADGVDLEVLPISGSVENLALVNDPASRVSAAFVQGGLASSRTAPELRSLGRLFYEPVWLFYQGPERLDRLHQLVGKRVLVGPAGSATAVLALRLLAADPRFKDNVNGPAEVKQLWQACQIPDFRKIAVEEHAQLVGNIFEHLRSHWSIALAACGAHRGT